MYSTYVHTCMYLYINTVFIRIEAWVFIFYKQFLTKHLYEPFLHFIQVSIYFQSVKLLRLFGPRLLYEPCFYSDKYSTEILQYVYDCTHVTTYIIVYVHTYAYKYIDIPEIQCYHPEKKCHFFRLEDCLIQQRHPTSHMIADNLGM